MIAESALLTAWNNLWPYLLIFAGFSAVIFVHELGHFLAAKWADVKVERFAIGFFREIVGFTRGETRYSFNILPLGGYVKMLGQEDFDDKAEELRVKDDPRAFTNKSVGKRMIIVSGGVVMNILFAAVLFVAAFTHGKRELVTTIGQVVPESPAEKAGLLPGDKILRINDHEIREYQEIKFAVVLANPHEPVEFEVLRNGRHEIVTVVPQPDDQQNLLQVGIAPATEPIVAAVVEAQYDVNDPTHVHPGDRIIEVNGQPVTEDDSRPIEQLLRSVDGAPISVTVERPIDPDDPDSSTQIVQAKVFNEMMLYPSGPLNDLDPRNILGLVPLVRVNDVDPNGRAALAGLKANDVILQWGPHKLPTPAQIKESIQQLVVPQDEEGLTWRQRLYRSWASNREKSIPVLIERPGQSKPIWLDITPKIGKSRVPSVGITWRSIADNNLRVANIVEQISGRPSPAAQAEIAAGSVIRRAAGKPVSSWHELVSVFEKHAGATIDLSVVSPEGALETKKFPVPHCPRTALGLSTLARITSVDGERYVTLKGKRRSTQVSASFPHGLHELLRRRLADNGGAPTTVTIRYQPRPFAEEAEATLEISNDTIDPWLSRVWYYPTTVYMQPKFQILRASGPLDALSIGVKKTVYFILQVYTMIERMVVSRSVGVEHMSGPVGIVKMGSDVARAGMVNLVFFIAIISANLAVINFLPLPIMDGGLMVFLIIEKVKGSPVSLQVQVVTQMIGLVLIGAAFIFVTFNDVIRLAG